MMDAVDLAILDELVADARVSMTDLADRVNVSRAHVYRRIDALRSAGVIRGFTADVDSSAAGLPVSALVLLEAHQQRWQELQEPLHAMSRVHYAAAVAGDVDVAVLIHAASVDELRDVVLRRFALLEAVHRARTLVVLDELVKPRPVLPDLSGPAPGDQSNVGVADAQGPP